jgi:hypothetical protein
MAGFHKAAGFKVFHFVRFNLRLRPSGRYPWFPERRLQEIGGRVSCIERLGIEQVRPLAVLYIHNANTVSWVFRHLLGELHRAIECLETYTEATGEVKRNAQVSVALHPSGYKHPIPPLRVVKHSLTTEFQR